MKRKVVLLQGGFSEERDISIKSSTAIHQALIDLDYETLQLDPRDFGNYLLLGEKIISLKPDIVFIGLHGGSGEDGSIQAFLSLLGLPFTGSEMKSSALCMDKMLSFALASSIGVKIPSYLIMDKDSKNNTSIIEQLGLPLVIKPNNSGSSVGISIVKETSTLETAIAEAFRYSKRVIAQKYIAGSELTVSILGDRALPVVEIKVKEGWYDYQNKYTKGKTIYEVPAAIPVELTKNIQELSLGIFKTFACRAYARVDFRYDGKDLYFLEVNTLPGMTSLSLTPMAAKEVGISFPELIKQIIDYSL